MESQFLKWLTEETEACWWHDSADPDQLAESIAEGAVGATTNPMLIKLSLFSRPEIWRPLLEDVPKNLKGAEKAEAIIQRITCSLAKMLLPAFEATGHRQGYVCAQVNPGLPGDARAMFEMAKRMSRWAPNITIKLPATAAGLEALEECAAIGIPVTVTASFTVPQALAIGEGYERGSARAKQAGITPARCFAVLMTGRLDDYLRDVAQDNRADIREEDIRRAGLAVAKRSYAIFRERGYQAVIMPAGMRGAYHLTELAGAEMVFSTAPKIKQLTAGLTGGFTERINEPVDAASLERLERLPEFRRAYQPDGMRKEEFITFGTTQKTLSQFVEAGWLPLENYQL